MTSEFRSEEMESRAFREEAPYAEQQRQPGSGQATYAGLDMGSYPGDATMDAYQHQGFTITCAYLANMPGRINGGGNVGWINAAAGLSAKRWGLVPTYVGAQASLGGGWPPVDPLREASVDAAEAVKLALMAGLVTGQAIFLDVESSFSSGSLQEAYVLKWIERVQWEGFNTAIYCFPSQIGWARRHSVKIWTVHLNSHTGSKDPKTGKISWCNLKAPLPADPIDVGAIGTQGRFYCRAANSKNEIDYDRWIVPDPSRV